MNGLEVHWTWDGDENTGIAWARSNVWSRSARRKRVQEVASEETQGKMDMEDEGDEPDELAALGVRIAVTASKGEVVVRWLKGLDTVLFESFCGMLKRAMTTAS